MGTEWALCGNGTFSGHVGEDVTLQESAEHDVMRNRILQFGACGVESVALNSRQLPSREKLVFVCWKGGVGWGCGEGGY